MKTAGLQWRVHWPTTLLALVLLPLLLLLGNWQLHRAEEKRIAQAALEQLGAESPTALEKLPAQPDTYARVQARGHFDNEHSFLLDNRVHNGRFGYEVITPFVSAQSTQQMLVDRGWIAGDPSRALRPAIDSVGGEVAIVGSIYRDTTKFNFFKTIHETRWPKLIQNLRIEDLQEQLGAPAYPFVLRLDANMPGAYQTDWQIFTSGFGPERHIAYAVTWFAMAATLLVTWILISSNLWQIIQGKKDGS
ncbi:MAG: hypothetical protein JWM78_2012 [Verrucomicrobiaceae bacterium]|nr:hypothetical protein [Verrucomicrobiaceae bacterium]